MNRLLIFIAISWILISCEEVVNLNLPDNNPRLVIEGLITNQNEPYYVKISHTSDYEYKYTAAKNNFEQNSIVIISDNEGNTDTLEEKSPGIYSSHISKIKGEVGRSYQLEIYTVEGKHYKSTPEIMPEVPKIDKIYFERDKSIKSPSNPDYYLYDIFIDWHDPSDCDNYYLRTMSYYWQNTWHDNIQWNWVFNDKYFNGQFLERDLINESYGGYNWKFRITQYSLTKNAYNFWLLVHQQTYENDNIYSNNSVPLIGNIYNVDNPNDYAIGYFQASAKTIAEVLINH